MLFATPLHLSHGLLGVLGTRVQLRYRERIPSAGRIILVSNHRSPLDAPLLMTALNRPVRFVCHYYMSRVPLLREMVATMGAFPLDAPRQRQKSFFRKSVELLQAGEVVGIFPEGPNPMIQCRPPDQLHPFQRGFAHLALRAPLDDVAILPVAIASVDEKTHNLAPLKLFSWADPSEPLFHRGGWHRAILYRNVQLICGYPVRINAIQKQQYQGRHAASLARELTETCRHQITGLLRQG